MNDKKSFCENCGLKLKQNGSCTKCDTKIKCFFRKYKELLKALGIFYTICIVLFVIVLSIHIYIRNNHFTIMFKESNVLETEIGEIKRVTKDLGNSKIKDNIRYTTFTIKTMAGDKYKIQVLEKEGTNGIYAYEINGKLIYEHKE